MPAFVGQYAGDTLWALALFLLLSGLLPNTTGIRRAAVALGLAYAVEVSQLFHPAWLDAIRSTSLGRLILGVGFVWSDFVCYTVGIATGWVVDRYACGAAQK